MLGCKKIVTGKNVYYIKTEWICFIMSVFHRKIIQVRSCSNVLWVTIYISSAKNFCQSVQKQRREAKWEEKKQQEWQLQSFRKAQTQKSQSQKQEKLKKGGDGTSWLYTGGVELGFGNLVGIIWGIETLSGGDCTSSVCHKIFGGVL